MSGRLRGVILAVTVLALVVGGLYLFARTEGLFGLSGSVASASVNPWFGPATFDGKPYSCPSQSLAAGDSIGSPAITPRISRPGPEQGAFSAADVRAYLLGNPPWSSSEHVTIYGVQLMDVSHAAALDQGQCVGLPGDAPVYLVTLHGNFPVNSWPTSGALPGTPPPTAVVGHVVLMVFDAHTGNLVATSSSAGATGQ